MAMLFNMKKPYPNLEVIASQKEEIRNICDEQGITTTALSRKAGVVPSTINRFMKLDPPPNALSSVTMAKIRSAYSHYGQTALNGRDIGLLSAFQVVFAILTKTIIKEDDLRGILTHQSGVLKRRNLPDAIEVVEQLLHFLDSKPRESEIQAIRKLLPPAQVGSA